jgi:hypothetical protein
VGQYANWPVCDDAHQSQGLWFNLERGARNGGILLGDEVTITLDIQFIKA